MSKCVNMKSRVKCTQEKSYQNEDSGNHFKPKSQKKFLQEGDKINRGK